MWKNSRADHKAIKLQTLWQQCCNYKPEGFVKSCQANLISFLIEDFIKKVYSLIGCGSIVNVIYFDFNEAFYTQKPTFWLVAG